jgi:fructokinase
MLLSCGDALIDFLPVKSTDGRDALVPVVGGSCLNIAVGVARLGAASGFVGGISNDLFGRMIADHAGASQVDLRYATRSEHQTTLAFVRSVDGEPHYAFYDEATASRNWTYRRGSIAFDEIDAIHVGSTTLIDENTAAETLAMVEDIRGSATISFDPNCRPNLVKHKARYVERMDAFAANAAIVRKSLLAAGASLVVVTRGVQGTQAWHREAGAIEVQAPAVKVVDTIGAGDSFQAALLFALRAIGRIEALSLAQANSGELRRALSFAAICAAFTCGRAGADPPRRSDVDAELSRLLSGSVE